MTRIRPKLLLVAVLLTVSGTPLAGGEDGPFQLEVSSPVVSGLPVVLRVTPRGLASEQPLAVEVIVNGEAIGRYEVGPGVSEIRLETLSLTPGEHRIQIKSGTLQAAVVFEVWPRWKVWLLLGIPLVLLAGSFAAFRALRRLRSNDVSCRSSSRS